MSETEEDDDIQEDEWENEGGAGVREPREPKNPPGQGRIAVAVPELVAGWYY